jgi:hypothetical protein
VKPLPAAALLGTALLACAVQAAPEGKKDLTPKEALQALNDFIGGWKGNGSLPKDARATWKETVDWSWRFKGKDAWLTLKVKGGRYLASAELRYLPDKGRYQLTAVGKGGKKEFYEGTLQKSGLVLERFNAKTEETRRVRMHLAGGGIRFVYTVAHKPANRLLFTQDYQVACTKIGETFGAREEKPECVVTGGLGTIPVSYKGVTYYVCCTGCRDAFNEDPEKYIKEYEARKRKK